MKIVDLNVLLYATNRDAAQHPAVRSWWEDALGDEEPIGLPWAVIVGFLRLSTNPRVFPAPLTPDEAIAKVDHWLSHSNIRLIAETEQHWHVLRELVRQTGTAGNLTTDAHLAAMAIANGATLVSFDTDFARFANLRWANPLQKA